MSGSQLLGNVLSSLEVELFVARHHQVSPDWRDIDYCPDYSKFYYIVEGYGWLKIGDNEYYPQPGQIVLVPEGVQQSYSYIDKQLYNKYWCHFSARIGNVNLFKRVDIPHICTVSDRKRFEKVFGELVHYANQSSVYAGVLAKAKLLELFSYYVQELPEGSMTLRGASSMARLTPVLSYMQEHMQQEMTINELAGVACLHPNYLIRIFKEQMGLPPIQYLVQMRLEKAKELLARGLFNVSEVAEQTGFSDMFHFSKQFKKMTGMSPSEYRKQADTMCSNLTFNH